MKATAASSFRDPGGRVFVTRDRVIRAITGDGLESWQLYAANEVLAEHRRSGRLIDFSPADSGDVAGIEPGDHDVLARHPRAPFPNYPHEWAPAMLQAAGS